MKKFFVLVESDGEKNVIDSNCYSTKEKALKTIADHHDCTVEDLIEQYSLYGNEFTFFDEGMNTHFHLKKFLVDDIQ